MRVRAMWRGVRAGAVAAAVVWGTARAGTPGAGTPGAGAARPWEVAPPTGLESLVKVSHLPLIPPAGWRCEQASSFSRRNVNQDAGNFIKVEGKDQWLLDVKGPGCIYRIWMTGILRGEKQDDNVPLVETDKARIRIYFDGEAAPTVNVGYPTLFGRGQLFPFLPPLSRTFASGKIGHAWEAPSSICYVPMPFEKSARIVGENLRFYHVTYHRFPERTKVGTFSFFNMSGAQNAAYTRAAEIMNNRGTDPKGTYPMGQRLSLRRKVPAREEVVLGTLRGPAIIDSLFMKVAGVTPQKCRGVTLKIWWDGEATPSVVSPIGDFFGTGFDERLFRSVMVGMTRKGWYSYFPMPFHRQAKVAIHNELGVDVRLLRFDVNYHRLKRLPDNMGTFHAQWRIQPNIPSGRDYVILSAEGRGKYVGCNLSMQSRAGTKGIYFLEGDEKIYVDDEEGFPPAYVGTGTEDYFNGSYYWNAVDFEHGPFGGLTYKNWDETRVCAYRFHVTDWVPFQERIRVTIEHGGTSEHPSDYASVAYWYQLEPHADFPPMPALLEQRWQAR